MTLNNNLKDLKVKDIYTLILFALYNMKEIPDYKVLSEMVYLTNKESFLNILKYFGGMTIEIPKLEDFTTVLNALLLYQYVQLEQTNFETALKLLNKQDYELKAIKEAYKSICEVLSKYEFNR